MILVVDDDDDLRESLVVLIQMRTPYLVQSASGVKQALEILLHESVAIVVTDVKMPGRDGMDLLKSIQSFSGPKPNVLVMSGFSEYSESEFLENGAVAYLSKPLPIQELIEQLKTLKMHAPIKAG